MPNITKQQAKDTAVSACAKERKIYDDLTTVLEEKKIALWKAQIPEEVMKLFKKYPDYFETRGSININNSFHVSLPELEELPGEGWNMVVPTKDTAEIEKLIQQHEKLSAQYYEHIRTIENTLINLKTFKKIEEALPEIAHFLPKGVVTTSLVIPVKDVQTILKMNA